MKQVDLDEEAPKKLMFYGGAGSGKTTLAAQAAQCPELSPVAYLDCELGRPSIKKIQKELRPDVYEVNNIAEVAPGLKQIRADPKKYKTIVIDTLYSLQKFAIEELTDKDIPSTDDYLRSSYRIFKIVDAIIRAKYNIILIAHEKKVVEKIGGDNIINYVPDLSEKFSNEICKRMDLIGRLTTVERGEEVVRVLLTNHTPRSVAKNRFTELPTYYSKPNMPKLLTDISKEKFN